MSHDDDEFEELPEPLEGIFTDVAKAVLSPPKWVVKGVIPVGLTFVAGPPKSYKSTMAIALAALMAGFEHAVLPPFMTAVMLRGEVLVLSPEANAGEVRFLLEAGMKCALKPGRLHVADDPFSFRLDIEEDFARLLYWLNERRPRLLLCDPLRDLHECEEKDSAAMIRILRPLREWAVANDAGVVMVHHTRKPGEGGTTYDAIDMRGSGAIFGKADGALIVTPRANGALTVRAQFKKGPAWEKTFTLAVHGAAGSVVAPASEVMDSIGLLVLRSLENGAPLQSIAEQLTVSKATVVERVKMLVKNELVERVEAQGENKWRATKKGWALLASKDPGGSVDLMASKA